MYDLAASVFFCCLKKAGPSPQGKETRGGQCIYINIHMYVYKNTKYYKNKDNYSIKQIKIYIKVKARTKTRNYI